MGLPTFEQLPFKSRPDLTPYLVHLTKGSKEDDNEYSAYDNLVNILKTGEVWGQNPRFAKGNNNLACFMDVPFISMKYIFTRENSDTSNARYEPYGIVVEKPYAYKHGCRPVLYLSDDEVKTLKIPESEIWRVVKFQAFKVRWISWIHEREWRCKGDFKLPSSIDAAFVKNAADSERLTKELFSKRRTFKCIPKSAIPFEVICQGLYIYSTIKHRPLRQH
jgi:hypothetical protein